ncbi:M20 family metallo-hydrolase [Aliiroseovarius sp. YM-037]|uniref:M20 family metallo-hydrolase n=1 Tax=Aliiroseovarius sp. YM-037 TaxID=3341728 RepID=UPI003A7F7808
MTNWGKIAAERLARIAAASAPGPGVTRLPFTTEHRQAIDILTEWMEQAGLRVHLDAAGTLIGRKDGPEGAGTFYIGSHQDSVREGGAFDGIMGVVLPILAMQRLKDEGTALPFAVEILAFADEEGVRFPTALMGPRALAGTFDPAVLEMIDKDRVSLRHAMEGFGLSPDQIGGLQRDPAFALGYLECHIEQGPVLEAADQPLGVVTAICGIERHHITLSGETGHAGTLPMESRRDALVGAAKIVSEVNQLATATPDLRGTVGALHVHPNVVNAVPKEVRMTVELRSPNDPVRERAGDALRTFAESVAQRRALDLLIDRTYAQPAQPCDEALVSRLANAVEACCGKAVMLSSGATHDASAMADLCPIAMLFVRCRGGVSHVPDEYASADDLGAAIDVLCGFVGQENIG